MLKWEGRDILETLPEIVDPKHTVVLMHDIQNDNTGPDGVFAKAGRRIDVTGIVGPIAEFLGRAREQKVRAPLRAAALRQLQNSMRVRGLSNARNPPIVTRACGP